MTFDEPADLILHGGKLTTLDPANPEATAIAVKGDRILTVGSDEQALMHFLGPRTTVIDLGGRRAVPGLNERPRRHGGTRSAIVSDRRRSDE
jgi:predicted amidohydrolase YtcJ